MWRASTESCAASFWTANCSPAWPRRTDHGDALLVLALVLGRSFAPPCGVEHRAIQPLTCVGPQPANRPPPRTQGAPRSQPNSTAPLQARRPSILSVPAQTPSGPSCVGQEFRLTCLVKGQYTGSAGWSSPVARWAHNPKVVGSNPTPATKESITYKLILIDLSSRFTPTDFPSQNLGFRRSPVQA